MSEQNETFGGDWSDTKLEALNKYLAAYTTALSKTSFTLMYIDAFAGNGGETLDDPSDRGYRHGSPLYALKHPFHHYVFIEKEQTRLSQLQEKINREDIAKSKNIEYICGDANKKLRCLCQKIDWNGNRAVAFIDPFACECEWDTLKAIAKTKAIDMWLLFPAMAVNRLLKRSGPENIPDAWINKLNKLFGTENWKKAFYKNELTLFGKEKQKDSSQIFENISQFVTKQLKTIFPGVNKNPLVLKNNRAPLFLFCFAAGNEKGARIALKIANHIIGIQP